MKGAYWPTFLAIAALSFAVTWKYAPLCVERLPDSVREMCRTSTHRAMQLVGREEAPPPVVQPADGPGRQLSGVEVVQPDDASIVPNPRASRPSRRETQGQTAAELTAGQDTSPQALPESVDPLDLPSTRGVMQADPKLATWGVVNQTTDLETLRGRDLGTIPGGRFFIIERRIRHEKGMLLAGNFWPRELAEPVQILAANVYTFSGRPENLSERQRRDLRQYYELRSKAMDLKKEITKRWYDENDNPHAGGDPTKDSRYLKLMGEMKKCAASIPGLVF